MGERYKDVLRPFQVNRQGQNAMIFVLIGAITQGNGKTIDNSRRFWHFKNIKDVNRVF